MVWDKETQVVTTDEQTEKYRAETLKAYSDKLNVLKEQIKKLEGDSVKMDVHISEKLAECNKEIKQKLNLLAIEEAKILDMETDMLRRVKGANARIEKADAELEDRKNLVLKREESAHQELNNIGTMKQKLGEFEVELHKRKEVLDRVELALNTERERFKDEKAKLIQSQIECTSLRGRLNGEWDKVKAAEETLKTERQMIAQKIKDSEAAVKSAKKQEEEASIALDKVLEEKRKNDLVLKEITEKSEALKLRSSEMASKEKELADLEKALIKKKEGLDKRKAVLDTIKVSDN